MKSSLPIFACLCLLGFDADAGAQTRVGAVNPQPLATADAGPASDINSGNALLRRVVVAVDAQRSIAAKLRQKVDVIGQELVGTGLYLQQGRGPERLLRLELKLQAGESVSSLQQICDGTNFWSNEDLGDSKQLSLIDLSRLRRARPKSQAVAPPAMLWLALGGLPKLVANLESSFRFGTPVEGSLDSLRIWTLEGEWEPARLIAFLPDQKDAIAGGQPVDMSGLAANLPDRVVLQVGCDDLFPYRIEYWRMAPVGKGAKSDSPAKLLVVMELFNVQFDVRIDPRQFVYQPGDVAAVDRTAAFLEKFGLEEVIPSGSNPPAAPRR